MKRLLLAVLFTFHFSLFTSAAEPLRVFIRSGPKTHGPGAHDHPSFLRDWVPLLNERGAKASGGETFPSKEQLDQTDVLIIHCDGGGDFKPEEKVLLDAYTKRGGGIVVIHAGSVSNTDTEYYKKLIGGSWLKGTTKWLEGPMNVYFTDKENPITKDMSNFAMDDEIYYDMDMSPEVKVLAGAYTPKPLARNEKAIKKAEESTQGGKKVSVYDIQPQIWTYEVAATPSSLTPGAGDASSSKLEGVGASNTGKATGASLLPVTYRAFVSIPGHNYSNFSRPNFRALLLRGIAWAGKRANTDEFCKTDELGDNLRYVEGGPTRPDKAAAKLEVHPDFNISLVASEPLINKVMNVDWDEKGRLWVCETPEYPNGRRELNVEKWKDSGSWTKNTDRDPIDRISWLEDTNGDGVMDKKHVFADKLELVTSFCFYKNGVIACAAPDIWYLEDTTGKGVCDKRTKLYTGLGTGDTHAVINNLRWGLDGWVYATHGYSSGHVTSSDGKKDFGTDGAGVVRFKPDGSAFEQYASRGGNTWGLDITWDGQVFFTQPTSGNHFIHVVLPEYVLAKGKLPGVMGTNGMLPREPTYPAMTWPEQAYVQIDQVGSYTAAAGCAIYEGGAWPEKWNYSYFCTEPTLNIVSHFFVEKDGVTYKAHREPGREKTEFIRSTDLWFRPIENRVGPDGALYVVDFYNQAVIHNDTRGPIHGPANAAVRPDRDHYFSRIWKVQHKEAKKLEVANLDRSNRQQLLEVLDSSPNAQQKMNALRLLADDRPAMDEREPNRFEPRNHLYGAPMGSQAYEQYRRLSFKEADDRVADQSKGLQARVTDILNTFRSATDDWSRSAVIAAASESPVDVILSASTDEESGKLGQLVNALLSSALGNNGATNAAKLILGIDPKRMRPELLQGIAQQMKESTALTPELIASLKKLLANPATADATLPIIVKWDKSGALADVVKAQLAKLSATLADKSSALPDRISAAKSLISLGEREAAEFGVPALAAQDTPTELKAAIIEALSNGGYATELVSGFTALKPEQQSLAFDAILKRPEATLALLKAIADGKVNPQNIGPGNIARLRTHPNKDVAKQANAMMEKLNPNAKAKNETIALLTPEVVKPGDAAKGKLIFTAACAICHKIGDIGRNVAPPLDGMGAHGPADLLIHIVDPNREVDPSFWTWNVTKKNGETFAGVIASENQAMLTLRNQVGEFEIRKEDIASKENTRRSLMPEGLEALGAENMRDILAFICGSDTRFRIVNLNESYTADTRRGLFASEEAKGDSVFPVKYGNVNVQGIPFFLMDPDKSQAGANVIALKGGGGKNAAQSYPQRVEVPVNVQAKRMHLLSGIAGWGYPAISDEVPAMKLTVAYADGQSEVIDLINGIHFSDYNRVVDVPGSSLAEGVVKSGQLRLISVDLKKTGVISKLVMESLNNGLSPVVCAITADIAGSGPVEAPPSSLKSGAGAAPPLNLKTKSDEGVASTPIQWENGKTKVLIVGGGSSHDFKKWFEEYDASFLKEAGYSVNTTENSAQATAELKNADVAIISTNRTFFDTLEWRAALFEFVAAGKGVIMLHPGTWYGFGNWPELNAQIVGGGSRGHDKLGPFQVNVLRKDHAIMIGVPHTFEVTDELYYMNAEADKIPAGTAAIEVLAETSPSQKYGKPHPSVWITDHPKARIIGIALGHDGRVHELPAFKAILTNSVKWVNGK
ncbi:hypothetical protein BH11VER1_BH11VER1_15590 [soil metagenome]